MALFLIKRLLQALFVIFAVTLLVAWAVRLSGDPAIMLTQGAGSVGGLAASLPEKLTVRSGE